MESNNQSQATKESLLKEKRKETNKKYYQKTREILKSTGVELKKGRPRTKPVIVDPDDTVIWKDVIGFDNYQVSDCGHIRNKKTKRILRPGLVTDEKSGHQAYQAHFSVNGKQYVKLVHVAMAESFDLPKPEGCTQVDHISRDSLDNRLENLRWSTPKDNMHNQNIRSNNTSGFRGVYLDKRSNRWYAQFNDKNSKKKHIGYFHCKEDAYCAYLNAMVNEYGFDNVIPELQQDYQKYCVEPNLDDDSHDDEIIFKNKDYIEYKCKWCDDNPLYQKDELIEHYKIEHRLCDDYFDDILNEIESNELVIDDLEPVTEQPKQCCKWCEEKARLEAED